VYREKGDYDRAVSDYEAALRIKPNDYFAEKGLERVQRERTSGLPPMPPPPK
jgi:tetratricopeptide (TPR) repeat protein